MHLSAGPTIRPESGIAENSALIWASCSAEWVGASNAVSENRSVEGSRPTEAQACARKSLRRFTFLGDQNRILIPCAERAAIRCTRSPSPPTHSGGCGFCTGGGSQTARAGVQDRPQD